MHESLGFTEKEKRVLEMYRDPSNSGLGTAARLSIQYALSAAIFCGYAILSGNAYWSLAALAIFVVSLIIRLLKAKRIAGVMPGVIAKYEARILELESEQTT